MVQDRSVDNSLKNLAGGLYSTFQKRKPSRQTIGGFINDINSTWEELSQEKIQNAIDLQPKIMQAIITADGGHTKVQHLEGSELKIYFEKHLYYKKYLGILFMYTCFILYLIIFFFGSTYYTAR